MRGQFTVQHHPNLPANQQRVQGLVDRFNADEREWQRKRPAACVVHPVSILAIDAAWTAGQPSGVALVTKAGAAPWRCLCVAPSYEAFVTAAEGLDIQWDTRRCAGDPPDVGRILSAATRMLGGCNVDVVTIDMPVARETITGRRAADNAISEEFGAAGCGTHSPTPNRPGALGANLTAAFESAGYSVAAVDDKPGTRSRLVEVYPHPALLRLMGGDQRLEYKAAKAGKYWPGTTVHDRIRKLLDVYTRILEALSREIEGIYLPLPAAGFCPSLAHLKRWEDALDALVCAWVGCRYIEGQAETYGDHNAAIWIPKATSACPSPVTP